MTIVETIRNYILRNGRLILLVLATAFLLSSCYEVELQVDSIPTNTPRGAVIFVAGNFNKWDPGDSRYTLIMGADSVYRVSLPVGFGKLEYKFTRGDWTTVETDECGDFIANRSYNNYESVTLYDEIKCWNDMGPTDCPRVTMILSKLPASTYPDDSIYMACNYNGWNPGNLAYRFSKQEKTSMYELSMYRGENDLVFKFTRGSWRTVEVKEDGSDVENHYFRFGQEDTVYYEIEEWDDRVDHSQYGLTFIVAEVPYYTPKKDKIFLVGDFNGWNPYDVSLILDKNKDGIYSISIPRNFDYIEYKFTRGGWETVEGNQFGQDIDNRKLNPYPGDTVYVTIESWKDRWRFRK